MDHTPLFATLAGAQFISLTTYRKSGEAVATPVWFAIAEPRATIYVESEAQTGKVKRIRQTTRVTLAPCTFGGTITGPTIEASARVVSDEEEMTLAESTLTHKYGVRRRLATSFTVKLRQLLRKPAFQTVYLAIEP